MVGNILGLNNPPQLLINCFIQNLIILDSELNLQSIYIKFELNNFFSFVNQLFVKLMIMLHLRLEIIPLNWIRILIILMKIKKFVDDEPQGIHKWYLYRYSLYSSTIYLYISNVKQIVGAIRIIAFVVLELNAL